MIEIFLLPLGVLCILVIVHAWFGIGVLQRGIIFTDLAIAQFAALGSAISLAYFQSENVYIFTLLLSLICALLIAMMSKKKLQLEAYIGILYIFASSAIMLVLANASMGMEHFKSLLANDILFIEKELFLQSIAIYLCIACLGWFLYPRLQGFKKELLFFSMLAVVVTSSVQLVGVLVVFVLLIAPVFTAKIFESKQVLFHSCIYGFMTSTSAVGISYYFDLPTGHTIVCVSAFITLLSCFFIQKKQV